MCHYPVDLQSRNAAEAERVARLYTPCPKTPRPREARKEKASIEGKEEAQHRKGGGPLGEPYS